MGAFVKPIPATAVMPLTEGKGDGGQQGGGENRNGNQTERIEYS
jgi:hypothetical protein